jgi:hypothetical protein
MPSLNFWRLIYGNLLDVAVLEWCKVFGSDAEPTLLHAIRRTGDGDCAPGALGYRSVFGAGFLIRVGVA